jgi:branched-chain amino acid transport system substrate-binding protein
MTHKTTRRRFLAGATASAGATALPMPSIAQGAPLKIGLLTVKTGPLAAGGIHFEEGISSFLKDKNFTLSGRKIDLIVADTGVIPRVPRPRHRKWSSATRSKSCLDLSRHSNCWLP